MYRVTTQFVFVTAPDARAALRGLVRVPARVAASGEPLPPSERDVERALRRTVAEAAQAAFREVAMAAKGLEISCHQFAFQGLLLAVSSRVRADGAVEIQAGLGDPALRASTFTERQVRAEAEIARRRAAERERERRRRRGW